MPQRSETHLSLWNPAENVTSPVYSFVGHTDVPREFLWRIRGGNGGSGETGTEDRKFQLITWSKNQHLRFWPIQDEVLRVKITIKWVQLLRVRWSN